MDRRNFFNQSALAATVLASAKAFGADHHKGHGEHKAPTSNSLIHALVHCTVTGEECLQHCMEMFAKGDTSMADCAAAVRDMLVMVEATRELAAQKSPLLAKAAALCATACESCKKVCEKYAKHPVCKACAESCAECVKECKKAA